VLPTDDGDLDWIARSLGHAGEDGTAQFLDLLCTARECVAVEFDQLLHDGRAPAQNGCRTCGPAPLPVDAEDFLAQLPAELAARVRPLCAQPKIKLLRDDSKVRLGRLVSRAVQAVAEARCTPAAAVLFVDWIEPLLRRESYLALLAERPEVQNRLLRLLGLARWPMRYLMLHPGVIDELADERLLHDRFDAEAYKRELEERHKGWERSSQAEEELLLDTLRRAHHAEVFRTLVRDVEGHITGRAGRRRSLGPRRRDALLRHPLGLEAPEGRASARAATGGHRLRQARRQGARLRQRPRRRLRLRRCRDRARQGGRGLQALSFASSSPG
jgi:glutamate-ammonia-ligase adenylyltransferase